MTLPPEMDSASISRRDIAASRGGTASGSGATQPSQRRTRRVLGSLAGLALAAVSGLIVWVDWQHPAAGQPAVTPLTVSVGAGTTTMVCPDGLRSVTDSGAGTDLAYDPQFDPAAQVSVSQMRAVSLQSDSAIGALTVTNLAGSSAADAVSGAGGQVAEISDPAGPTVVKAEPAGPDFARAAAAVAFESTSGDLRGLAAASCQEPGTDLTIIGGSTEAGASARLVLVNPGATAASVDIELYGAAGAITANGLTGIAIPPQSERAILLEGVVNDARRLAVHITSSGGAIAAFLQDNRIDGITPRGVEFAVPSPAAATGQVISGIQIAADASTTDPSVLRIYSPGSKDATVEVAVWGSGGATQLPGFTGQSVEGGTVSDISLAGLPAGTYTVAVDSSQPVVAAAMVTTSPTTDGGPSERSWIAASPGLESGAMALPAGVDGTLVMGAGSAVRVSLTAVDAAGAVVDQRMVDLTPSSTLTLNLQDIGGGIAGLSFQIVTGDSADVGLAVALVDKTDSGDLTSVLVPAAMSRAVTSVTVARDPLLGLSNQVSVP